MPFKSEIDSKLGVVRVEVWGVDTPDAMALRVSSILADPRWIPGYDLLVDYSRLTEFDFTADQLEQMRRIHQGNQGQLGDGASVIVDPRPESSGITQLFASIASDPDRPKPLVFHSRAEAEAYLEERRLKRQKQSDTDLPAEP